MERPRTDAAAVQIVVMPLGIPQPLPPTATANTANNGCGKMSHGLTVDRHWLISDMCLSASVCVCVCVRKGTRTAIMLC